jgi:hypothetical protein
MLDRDPLPDRARYSAVIREDLHAPLEAPSIRLVERLGPDLDPEVADATPALLVDPDGGPHRRAEGGHSNVGPLEGVDQGRAHAVTDRHRERLDRIGALIASLWRWLVDREALERCVQERDREPIFLDLLELGVGVRRGHGIDSAPAPH